VNISLYRLPYENNSIEYYNRMESRYPYLDTYPIIDYINLKTPMDSKILLWSNDGYFLDRDYLYALGFITSMGDSMKIYDSDLIIDELKRFGITHVVMVENYLRNKLKNTLLDSKQLNILYTDNKFTIASLP
tara:strand:- start:73 stop:468 length:396 start_codon:yes stop_codon:yes gene_type:complete